MIDDYEDTPTLEKERYFRISPEDDEYVEECTEADYLEQIKQDEEENGPYEYDADGNRHLTQEAFEAQDVDSNIHDPYYVNKLFSEPYDGYFG